MRQEATTGSMVLYGQAETAALAIYAAILDPQVSELILDAPPESHAQAETAALLGVLRVGDLPQNLALLYPRPITFIGKLPPAYEWTKQVYEKLGAGDRIRVVRSVRDWIPLPR